MLARRFGSLFATRAGTSFPLPLSVHAPPSLPPCRAAASEGHGGGSSLDMRIHLFFLPIPTYGDAPPLPVPAGATTAR